MTARAIILVAGIASRIRDVTGGLPKSFLQVGDETLIGRHLRLLRGAGVTDITLLVGFMEDMFREAFPECSFVTNPDFQRTNTSVSLELALRHDEAGKVFVINGDVYYDEGVIEAMLESPHDTIAAVKRHPLSDEEVKVMVEGDRVQKIGKYLNHELALGEAFGVYLLSPQFAKYMKRELKLLNNPAIFYEAAMDKLLSGGHVMQVLDVGESLVQEVDFPSDYKELTTILASE